MTVNRIGQTVPGTVYTCTVPVQWTYSNGKD
jgi:hypothetical protein